ncbi:LacI family DNA-binding transcriptional regulator [Ruania suaedae]|uniref:LacI family DNA-binding transcriptional regulator n=1 Tax=Ruania suaedae TaxID=2897774 RepID=UPI001E38900F|nr:LacI family DNA-binding transcriptional regulator [Ruania suaedae]UFU03766.1 LacI family DNA-binding transcriptional regulator [Ruania suaedae]
MKVTAQSAGGEDAPGPARPVMTDVARLAGVSQKTVSRVVRGEANVSPAVRDRVHAAIAELGFRPNTAARALASGRHRTLGIVTDGSALYGPSAQLVNLEHAAWKAGYAVMIAAAPGGDRDAFSRAIQRLVDGGVDGVLVGRSVLADAVTAADLQGLVTIAVGDPPPPGARIPAVVTDQQTGARLAVEHLLGLGHATVHHLSGPMSWHSAQGRAQGWAEALEGAGADVPAPVAGDWTSRSGYERGRELAATDATAIFAANDQMAIGLTRALTEAGRRVPEDVSVVGFDDIPDAAYLPVPLTTVRQEFAELAALAVDLFARESATAARSSDAQVTVTPELIVRDSTAPPPDSP